MGTLPGGRVDDSLVAHSALAGGGAGHWAALVAIDRNGRDCRNAQLFSGIDFTKN